MDIEKLRKDIEQKGQLRYIKLARKNQFHYYDYKNLSVVLRIDASTDLAQYISITRKDKQCNYLKS